MISQGVYGSPDLLSLREIEVPVPAKHEVRVRVHSAALHVGDCFGVRGKPLLMRMETGLRKPKHGIPGYDVAGYVDAVGEDVTRFQVGDQVFGSCQGACAELVCTGEDTLALKPSEITFEQAAAVPTSGLAALHALRDVAKVQARQSVLIIGASGGVGTFAVQIAKSLGAEVTGVCSTPNVDLVRSLGADHVFDYTREDFAESGRRYDVIFDNIENRSLSDCRRALTPTGTLILNSGTGAQGVSFLVRLLKPLLISPFLRQRLCRYLSTPNAADLSVLAEMLKSAAITPVIGRTYSLIETADAIRHIETGRAKGKTIIRIGDGG
ncbi:alcohol dehydrogenase zinc-binding domain containing protein [Rhodopirellula maiorica SM1]|uniref:Alcohol dehydrogenase zinc-binding domain containing protein n=1 Tax=Rhodopirellula maiorica SM1 TaxID=1265738 RepID=M5RU04_9BACT|nr:NAD(P)-dependent alcohol dehydrogenase [Rhodopirellula maiorica]EMI17454.1 alcohol dehydrogenase zinc-binding domain containing protein [Rhodopirellula maiorica SM1]